MKKSGQNKFAGYSYFELGDFIPHVQTIFNDLGLCGVVTFNTEYAQLCITDTDDGTVIVITTPMAEANLKGAHPIQNLGAVLSYQRRYLWMAAMELVEGDAVDSAPPVEAVKAPEPKQPLIQPLKPPVKPVKGKVDPIPPQHVEPDRWTIYIEADDDVSWVAKLLEVNELKIGMAESAEDLKGLYQINRAVYDKLKALDPKAHLDVIERLTAAKKSFF
jgi:hypothetical protein